MYSLGINKFTPPHGVISAKKTLLCGLRTAFLCIFHKQSYTNKYIIEMSNRTYRSNSDRCDFALYFIEINKKHNKCLI